MIVERIDDLVHGSGTVDWNLPIELGDIGPGSAAQDLAGGT